MVSDRPDLHHDAVPVGQLADLLVTVLGLLMQAINAELQPIMVLLHDPVIQLFMLNVQRRIREDAGLEQVIAKVNPPTEVFIYVWKGRLKCLLDHSSILLSYYLVTSPDSRPNVLSANCPNFGYNLARL